MILLLAVLLQPAGPLDAIERRIVDAITQRQTEQMEALGDRIKKLTDAMAEAREERAAARRDREGLLAMLAEARLERNSLKARLSGVHDRLRDMLAERKRDRESWTPLLILAKRLINLGYNLIWLLVLVAVIFEGTRLLIWWIGKRVKEFLLPIEDIVK